MTDEKKTKAKPTKYDEAFRQEAIRLWKNSGQSAERTARELGISVFQLYEWSRAAGGSRAADVPQVPETKEELQKEVARLQRELARMTDQRDILKKAAGILSEPSQSGMPGLRS